MKLAKIATSALPIAALLAFAPLATADAQYSGGFPPLTDEVSLMIAEEGWVETDTARVVIRLEAVADGADAAALRASFLNVLIALDDEAEWRFLSYDRRQDETGLERWTARAEARLPETGLDGLAAEADEASRPGLSVRVEQTDFSPTLADREETAAELRLQIYERAGQEVAALNEAFPDRAFRIAGIDFDAGDMRPVMMERAQAAPMAMDFGVASSQGGGAAVSVAEMIEVRARVRLSAFAESVPAEKAD